MFRVLRALLVTVIGSLAVLASVVGSPARASAPSPDCQSVTVAVTMAPDEAPDQQIAGTLCTPAGQPAAAVQLLLPGGTYDQTYWSRHGDPNGPSYVEAMTQAGYATLAIDRLGTGRSSRPPSDRFVDQTHELVGHQLVQGLRQGVFGGQRFTKVILVGNSFGSTIARMVAVNHPDDVDGLILTGESSTPNWEAFAALEAEIQPANQDQRLAWRGLDGGYVTVKPGAKAAWFYHPPTAEARVVALDEATPEPDIYPADPAYGDVALNKRIRVPTLIVVGEYDRLICGEGASDCSSSAALLTQQAEWFSPGAQLETLVVADTGHVLNLHRTAPAWYAYARDWADRHVGTSETEMSARPRERFIA